MDGKVWPGTCWFENECPYEILADRELGPLHEFVATGVKTVHRRDAETKREWDETAVSRGTIKFACWAFGVTKPSHRRRALAWILLAAEAMNAGRNFVSELDEAEMKAAREDAERRAREYTERQVEKERKRVARERRAAARAERDRGGRARNPSQG